MKVWLKGIAAESGSYKIRVNLSYKGNMVYFDSKDIKLGKDIKLEKDIEPVDEKGIFNFKIENPALWSTQSPNLYKLDIELSYQSTAIDRVGQMVGFKEFKAEGTRFYINGEDIFLKGVCRHDMWGDSQGHTLTKEQMEKDLMLIKGTGANYIRLVHYPHHKYIIELADKIGLLVSGDHPLGRGSHFCRQDFAWSF